MITLVGIHYVYELVSECRVHQLIYLREWIAIFGTCLVEIPEVDIDSSFAPGLGHQYHVCQPRRELYLPYLFDLQ